MKVYPKVFRYDHDAVPDDFFTGEGYIIEKVDGGNARFCVYDERYSDEFESFDNQYEDETGYSFLGDNPSDGDVFLGLKKTPRGEVTEPLDSFDGALWNAVRKLRTINTDAVRDIHDEVGPVMFFAENMVYHSLDYQYDVDPPPALIGFDVCSLRDTDDQSRPPNPFNQRFTGFLSLEKSMEIFENMGIEPIVSSENVVLESFEEITPDEFDIPKSKYADDTTAEGVIFRKPDSPYRVKIVRESFKEINNEGWGYNLNEAETGNEKFIAKFCTPARVEKTMLKMVVDEGRDLSMELIEDLIPRVIDDVWEEEWYDIKDADIQFNPSEVKRLITPMCREAVKRRVVNARLNGSDPKDTFE